MAICGRDGIIWDKRGANLGVTIQPLIKFGVIGLTEGNGIGKGDPHPPFRSPHGFSEVTRETPETVALRREAEEAWKGALCEAVVTLAKQAESLPLRGSYAEVTERFGGSILRGRWRRWGRNYVSRECGLRRG
jgi:hypothetical protein